jgi:peptide/nickel transport system permease protein
MSAAASGLPASAPEDVRERRASRSRRISVVGWIGIAITTLCVAVGLFGPFFAPHDPEAFLGVPLSKPAPGAPLGFDYLGRDALSRFLWGGRTAIIVAVLGFAIGAVVGLVLGLVAAYFKGTLDVVIDRSSELIVGFPSLILMMLLIAGLGPQLWVIVVALGVVHLPRVTRIVRAAGMDVADTGYVEVAEARGEYRHYVMFREMLPGVMPTFLVDAGIRIPASILLVASLSFLGLGIQPPAADWGLIISENRIGITTQPWAMVGPIVVLALLMVGVNIAIDSFQRVRTPTTWR